MHFTPSFPAEATLFLSLILSSSARVFPNVNKFLARREKRQLCTSDIYASVLGDPQYQTDIHPFCISFISIPTETSTLAVITPRTYGVFK